MKSFSEWLLDKDIDVQSLDRQLRAALVTQFEAEQKAAEPPSEAIVLVDADAERWPARVFRVPA